MLKSTEFCGRYLFRGNRFKKYHYPIAPLGYYSAYFGATDKENEGTWVWVTDEEFIYNNWHNNEPNNERGDEDYAMFYYKYSDGTWNDGGIKTINANLSQTPYICEWDNFDITDESQDEIIQNNTYSQSNNKINSGNSNILSNQISSNMNDSLNNQDKKEINITFQINNLSLIGGVSASIFGGISFIGLLIKTNKKYKRRKKDD